MIPKKIHYCWFGGKPLPELALKCIESWKKFCPDYEIKEWNESNFDLNCCDYVKEAYEQKKWAFVSDYARFKILYEYGGIYFDTDVELIKPIDEVVTKGAFMGCELTVPSRTLNYKYVVATGLGMGAPPKLQLYNEILSKYSKRRFLKDDGTQDLLTVVIFITKTLIKYGYKDTNKIQKISDITIYPVDYFCPLDPTTGLLNLTNNTISIHHYTGSWLSEKDRKWLKFERKMRNNLGERADKFVCSLPVKVIGKVYRSGIKSLFYLALKK